MGGLGRSASSPWEVMEAQVGECSRNRPQPRRSRFREENLIGAALVLRQHSTGLSSVTAFLFLPPRFFADPKKLQVSTDLSPWLCFRQPYPSSGQWEWIVRSFFITHRYQLKLNEHLSRAEKPGREFCRFNTLQYGRFPFSLKNLCH